MSSKHFNEEFESNLSDDRNVLHVHEQGISSLVLFAKYYDSRFVIHLQFEFQESKKYACSASPVNTHLENKIKLI